MQIQSTRDRIIEAMGNLPPDASYDDAIERIILLAKVEAGLAELDAGLGISHDTAMQRLGL